LFERDKWQGLGPVSDLYTVYKSSKDPFDATFVVSILLALYLVSLQVAIDGKKTGRINQNNQISHASPY
jgi:hypothetical protein